MRAVDLSSPGAARWLASAFDGDEEPPGRGARSLLKGRLEPLTWAALRAPCVASGPPSSLTLEAARRALAPEPVEDPVLALHSATGMVISKVSCFVFGREATEPRAVVRLMPRREDSERLRGEAELIEQVRARVGADPDVADALPEPPLFAGDLHGDYVTVLAPDPLASATGACDRAAALRWLAAFQRASTAAAPAWDAAATQRELEAVRLAWSVTARSEADRLLARVEALLERLHGEPVPRCAVHGDFWRGNLACRGGRMRVYDWEWAALEGHPFSDLWFYELGEIRHEGARDEPELARRLESAIAGVESELRARAVPESFACATLAPALGRLAFRARDALPNPADPLPGLMRVAERLLD